MAHRTGIRLNIVHYRGSGPALAGLVAGDVPLMMDSVVSAIGNIRAGRLRAIAVATPRRTPWFPDVPTIAETVSPGFEALGWSGLVAPATTPGEIVRNRAGRPFGALCAGAGRGEGHGQHERGAAHPGTPEAFGAFIRAEIVKWREVAWVANVTL